MAAHTVTYGQGCGQQQKHVEDGGSERITGKRLWVLVTWEILVWLMLWWQRAPFDKSLFSNNCPNLSQGLLASTGQRVPNKLSAPQISLPKTQVLNCWQCVNWAHRGLSPFWGKVNKQRYTVTTWLQMKFHSIKHLSSMQQQVIMNNKKFHSSLKQHGIGALRNYISGKIKVTELSLLNERPLRTNTTIKSRLKSTYRKLIFCSNHIGDSRWKTIKGTIQGSGFFSFTKPLQDSHHAAPRKKLRCLARLGTTWICHQTHLSAARIITCWLFFFFQSLQKKPQKDKKECQWCELHQGNTTSLGWHTQQHLKGPRHRDVSAADVPSLTTSRSSQKNLSQLQRAGLWGHQVDPSRRMKGKAPALRAGTSPIFPAPHSWRKLKLHRKRSSVSFY